MVDASEVSLQTEVMDGGGGTCKRHSDAQVREGSNNKQELRENELCTFYKGWRPIYRRKGGVRSALVHNGDERSRSFNQAVRCPPFLRCGKRIANDVNSSVCLDHQVGPKVWNGLEPRTEHHISNRHIHDLNTTTDLLKKDAPLRGAL